MRSTVVIFVLAFAALGLLLGFSESFDTRPENAIDSVVADVESRIDLYVAAMQATSELPQVKSTDYTDLISVEQMGIPEDADDEKREVARQLLSDHAEFASIFFLTPSGDIYIGEPFVQQEQLPRLNYADRDWYKGASTTNDAYVSSVFMSAAIHVPAIAIAVPVYEGTEVRIAGYWVAIVDVSDIDSSLRQISGGGSRILLVDHNGTQIADTGKDAQGSELKSFAKLQSVKKALSGQAGTIVEQVDGTQMTASYAPVKAHPHTWAIVFMQPAGDTAPQ
ncbi:MAG: cache domain-containing protein [Nitrososphaera sp.]